MEFRAWNLKDLLVRIRLEQYCGCWKHYTSEKPISVSKYAHTRIFCHDGFKDVFIYHRGHVTSTLLGFAVPEGLVSLINIVDGWWQYISTNQVISPNLQDNDADDTCMASRGGCSRVSWFDIIPVLAYIKINLLRLLDLKRYSTSCLRYIELKLITGEHQCGTSARVQSPGKDGVLSGPIRWGWSP